MQQLIPRHGNAVNMAKLLFKTTKQDELAAVEDLEDFTIIVFSFSFIPCETLSYSCFYFFFYYHRLWNL